MPCMGPDTDHVDSEAEALTQAVINVLENHGVTRPTVRSGGSRLLNKFDAKMNTEWDAEVVKLKACIKELMTIDAAASF